MGVEQPISSPISLVFFGLKALKKVSKIAQLAIRTGDPIRSPNVLDCSAVQKLRHLSKISICAVRFDFNKISFFHVFLSFSSLGIITFVCRTATHLPFNFVFLLRISPSLFNIVSIHFGYAIIADSFLHTKLNLESP